MVVVVVRGRTITEIKWVEPVGNDMAGLSTFFSGTDPRHFHHII